MNWHGKRWCSSSFLFIYSCKRDRNVHKLYELINRENRRRKMKPWKVQRNRYTRSHSLAHSHACTHSHTHDQTFCIHLCAHREKRLEQQFNIFVNNSRHSGSTRKRQQRDNKNINKKEEKEEEGSWSQRDFGYYNKNKIQQCMSRLCAAKYKWMPCKRHTEREIRRCAYFLSGVFKTCPYTKLSAQQKTSFSLRIIAVRGR